jgi:hypothetical protein
LSLARSIFSMMSETVAVQMNGPGLSFQACMNWSIACFRSGTLTKLPRRLQPRLHVRLLVGAVVVHHQVQLEPGRELTVEAAKKLQPHEL